MSRSILFSLLILFSFSCTPPSSVELTGSISDWSTRDSAFVSLTANWEDTRSAPDSFSVDRHGNFYLRFSVLGNPPPVSLIKNGRLYAKLSVHGWKEHSVVIIDEMRNSMVELRPDTAGVYRGKLKL